MDSKSALAARIANLREGMFPQLRNGYALIGKLQEPIREEVVDELIDSVANGGVRQIDDLAERLKISEDEAGTVLFAVAAVTGALLDIEASTDDFLDVASHFYASTDKEAAKYVADKVIAKRPTLKSQAEQFRLSTRVIPAFSELNYTIDIRLEFKSQKISQATPVALLNILTDVSDEKIFMQINENQISTMIAELIQVRSELEIAREVKLG